jgi:hypothetical protein
MVSSKRKKARMVKPITLKIDAVVFMVVRRFGG